MERSSCVKVLELQKFSCLHAQARKVSPNKMEWKKVKEKGRGFLDKIECSSAYKRMHFLPSTTTHLGCCKLPSNHENQSKASIPFGILQFHALFPIFFLSLSHNTHPESKLPSHLQNLAISCTIHPSSPFSLLAELFQFLTELSSSCRKIT
ncbi:hypothetical protein Pyn_05316 [Prunus yedoensis var. nudiflora]|uniref:Uncharacterized protein n=1 Tax=Prunus yedoensis var. nudiflora TaxID=2094558 RepID=A0A314YTP2_PRUYE|nr:hypothetical protein Pyn_05316 [Prunus yedoensis var. nudiflora]